MVLEFGSQKHLQSSMAAAANGMSASGWIWLVSDQAGHLGIVPTYGAGTLLVRARQQRNPPIRGELPESRRTSQASSSTMNPSRPPSSSHSPNPESASFPTSGTVHHPPPPLAPKGQQARSTSSGINFARSETTGYSTNHFLHDDSRGVILNPLLCISVYEHAWLSSGYGIWGKKEYLRRFWSVVDWVQVTKNYDYWNRVGEA
jgi:Fe-Mn family superoxide dismutase